MTWTTKSKDLGIVKTVPHANADPSVTGRAPGVPGILFSPLELFGAAARCSHLHTINPAAVTPESLMIAALLEQHVDDVKSDFAIEASADSFKDFIKSYFAGTVAAGLAYLAMINDGYVWSDHFENLGGGFSGTLKTPDFVFAGGGTGVALVEAKGSRSASPSAFEARVRDGYIDQVEPHLGHAVGGVQASHGYCIGAYLRSTTKADLRIHHTAVPAAANGGGSDAPSIAAIQRGNFATAFSMAHSEELGEAIRHGEGPADIPFFRFEWRGRAWLTSYGLGGFRLRAGYFVDDFGLYLRRRPRWDIGGRAGPSFSYAIEEKIALTALRRFLGGAFRGAEREGLMDMPTLPFEGSADIGEVSDGTAFPDGLAILGAEARPTEVRPVVWDRDSGDLASE